MLVSAVVAGLVHGADAGDIGGTVARLTGAALVDPTGRVGGPGRRRPALRRSAPLHRTGLGRAHRLPPARRVRRPARPAEWLVDLSPFAHLPALPGGALEWTPLVALTVVAAVAGRRGRRGAGASRHRLTSPTGSGAPSARYGVPMTGIPGFWAVIPAGGSGTRLWPISRRASPKFLHDLTGSGQSLLRATWDRLEPLVDDRILVVTGGPTKRPCAGSCRCSATTPSSPSPRRATRCPPSASPRRSSSDATPRPCSARSRPTTSSPSRTNFRRAVEEAVVLARRGELVTIGIEPTHPATGFGYIRLGEPLGVEGAPSAHRVDEFVEKPDAETAARYLESGDYRWNAGMFVVGATTLLELLAENHDEMVEPACAPSRATRAGMRDLWPALARSPSTTRSPSPPPPRAGSRSCPRPSGGTTWVTSSRSPTSSRSRQRVPGIKVIGPGRRRHQHRLDGHDRHRRTARGAHRGQGPRRRRHPGRPAHHPTRNEPRRSSRSSRP